MIAIGISEEACLRHEKANHFCLEVLENCLELDRFNLVEYNNKEPGVIFYTEDWACGSHYAEIRKSFRDRNVDSYFDILLICLLLLKIRAINGTYRLTVTVDFILG